MAQLAVGESPCRLAVDDQADAHAGADRDVGEVGETPARTPAHFRPSGTVHVCVESRLRARCKAEPPSHLGSGPFGLGRLRNETPVWRPCIKVDRTEAVDSQACNPLLSPVLEETCNRAERLLRRSRRDRFLLQDGVRSVRKSTNALRAAQFHARIGQAPIVHRTKLGVPGLAVESGPDPGNRQGKRVLKGSEHY